MTPTEHSLTHARTSNGELVPACVCGWYSIDGSHWGFERHLRRAAAARSLHPSNGGNP